ncbi:MAG: HDIG domain-containing metalloprotein [Eubacteriales bacterium]
MTEKAEQKFFRNIAKGLGNHKVKRIGFAVTFVTLVLSYAIIVGIISPSRENMMVGELATETITAPSDIEDTVTTEQLRNIAADAVEPIYTESKTICEETETNIALFFSRLENARAFAEETYINAFNEQASKRDQIEALNLDPAEIVWTDYLNESDFKTVCSLATIDYSESMAISIASLEPKDIDYIAQKTGQILSSQDFDTDVLMDTKAYQNAVKNTLAVNFFFSEEVLKLADLAIDQYVESYIALDSEAVEQLKKEASDAVEPVIYRQGQNITVKGEVVTEAQYAMLEELGLTTVRPITAQLYISLFVFLALIYFGFYTVMAIFENGYFKRVKHTLILSLVMVMVVAVMTLSEAYQSEVLVIIFASIMCTVLAGRRVALSFNLSLALVYAAIIIWKKGQVTALDFEHITLVIVTGSAVPLFLKNASRRSSVIQAAFGAGVVGAITIISLGIMRSMNMHDIILRSLWCFFSCPLNGVIAIGLLPLWEMIFGMATQTKLLELCNTNRKVLQRLMHEAPGTFYHSSMVANLSERAAEALGANGLLVRAAALYHDIGKLDNPLYFTENESEGNPHDSLSNIESAAIIIGHVAASVRMTKADGIPKDVIEIISQHHGNALLPNFYYKEKEKNPKVDEELFRYPFCKPTTKEAGILMIADTVEAAMRSAVDLTPEQRRDRINSLVVEKLNHGLLDECPLTRKELGVCANIFTISLENASHKRIKYKYNLSGQVQK